MSLFKRPTVIILAFILVSLVAVYYYWSQSVFSNKADHLDSLFSGFAFVGLIGTIFLQMQELRETREQLAKSAEAQVQSEQALRDQQKSMDRSALINGYAAMLNYYANAKNLPFDPGGPAQAITNTLQNLTKELERERKATQPTNKS